MIAFNANTKRTTSLAWLSKRGMRKERVGEVVSHKMQKTIVVRVVKLARHPIYPRTVKTSSTFKVHDEANSAKKGDWVRFEETRPMSKDKRWRLVEILKRASTAPGVDEVTAPAEGSQG
jgi:small subunit ribosomal protein S17